MAYNLVISEAQRLALAEALRRLSLVHLEPIAVQAENPDDVWLLLDMLDDLPSQEAAAPGITHGLNA